ncbi:MAG: tetratricopeptide repeat protein [Candidatus Omnitrophica bacterium]|nr:tetratricopeptide repeat protein [Candidatus Omnitrophota bacterium]
MMVMGFTDLQFKKFKQVIAEGIGLHCSSERLSCFSMIAMERMKELELPPWAYLKRLEEDPTEFECFVNLITVGETYFFRDEKQFDILKKFVIPKYVQKAAADPGKAGKINIWSAGVSTGEEAYGIAILFKEAFKDFPLWTVSILGTDINTVSLETARKGIYQSRSLQNVCEADRERYFIQTGKTFEVCDEIKEMVRFERLNLVKGPYGAENFSPEGFDIVFCRNVTIYFEVAVIKRIIPWFHRVMVKNGYLFLGATESLWGISNLFHPIEFPHAFIYQRQNGTASEEMTFSVPMLVIPKDTGHPSELCTTTEPSVASPSVKNGPGQQDALIESRKAYEHKEYSKALEMLNDYMKRKTEDPEAAMLKAHILSNQEQYEAALKCLDVVLKKNNLDAQAYYLKAIIFSKMKALNKAVDQYKKALYVNYDLAMVHFKLADLFRISGDRPQANRHYQETVRLLKTQEEQSEVTLSDGMTAGALINAAHLALSKMEEPGHE